MHEDSKAGVSRRDFILGSTKIGTTAVVINYLGTDLSMAKAKENIIGQPSGAPEAWGQDLNKVPFRYDGLAKVMGQKLYAFDIRAKDLKGWPLDEERAVILRANDANKVFEGIDSKKIKKELGVDRLVSSPDLEKAGIKPDGFFTSSVMAQIGKDPQFLGQPVGLAYFSDTERFLDVRPRLADISSYLKFGASTKSESAKAYGTSRIVRYTDDKGQELFSYAKDGSFRPPWQSPNLNGSNNARASYYAEKIKKDLNGNKWQLVEGKFGTQSVDPVFMEAEGGLAWYDPDKRELHMTLGTQSPLDDAEGCLKMLAKAKSIKIDRVVVNTCYPGGGFGGRDHSEFPLYLCLAAIFNPGKSIRVVHSRFDQFQAGLKRHAAQIKTKLAVDKQGKFQAFHTDMTLDGGGQNNYSFAVQNVGGRNASSGYAFPRSWVDSQAKPSIGVPAGSMRGFGSLQAAFAMECLVDEAAEKLKIDPIDLRMKNIITDPQAVHTGTVPLFRINSDLLLEKARQTSLWKNRDRDKKNRSKGDTLYGVGVALAVKSYGKNPGDTCLSTVMIDADGKLSMHTNSVDMGNGTATTLPQSLSGPLGRHADQIKMGVSSEFEALKLYSKRARSQEDQDKFAKDPRWVPFKAMSTAASAGAYQMRHACIQAAEVLLKHGLWPAALSIWQKTPEQLPWRKDQIRWEDGALSVPGQVKIPLKTLAAQAHKKGLVTGAMVHTYYRAGWTTARYSIEGQDQELKADALALRHGKGEDFKVLTRSEVNYPPMSHFDKGADLYTPYAVVAAVEVNRKSGKVKVVGGETFLDCGQVVNKDIVEGQMHGAWAMGIGQTLFEDSPKHEGGPGQGGWNLHRYMVPRARDVAVESVKFNIVSGPVQDPPKGMAEVVLNAVPPAIVNAIAHATGKRFRQLPIQPKKILESLS
ncbi:xanthine dehydrogenase family protein molybdopterin-binding subunit [Pseudobacteriovorax antillogorgiicola]|uniref:CO or xanthine dehydrogenase, Mo-binding subunit n=1 Tax=Pseudobacteriovorax antillogorgiicola TaxID=1513793 RepID=A0A1Y6CQP1_9BACT|nr:molybdopterin cofactor-binding domain-containing protein [Pseudobacteriovorax antillogorgiicola]TCS42727.1 CO/xanthine dehydrogenase Mo-binding subunit [Pseudobacteriovorax antillogorgiicola]SMF82398.1 CO or xanthine dehydrogenase, Mo-binding subunit [Pseudobacteriovorax antillogorgiicola]